MAPALVSLKENPPKNRIENIRPPDWPLSSSQLIFCLFFSSHLYFVYSFVFALHASLPLLLLIELKSIEQLDSRSTDVILLLLLFAQRR